MTQVAQFSQSEVQLLQNIGTATDTPQGFGFADPSTFANLRSAQMVESLESERNPQNPIECAVRITDAGRNYLQSMNGQAPAVQVAPAFASGPAAATSPANAAAAPSFTLRSDIAIPKRTRAVPPGAKKSRYPFETMQVGQSFHVKASDLANVKDPFKAIASSVAAANRKYSTVTTEPLVDKKGVQRVSKKGKAMFKSVQERHYTCAKVSAPSDPDGDGIRVFRQK